MGIKGKRHQPNIYLFDGTFPML